ncbi:TetR/AcrR family transcriptional regulator [Acrocarpospora sp. B8E8]|uniref:TetR/AcrR family transcriptional regulator n=1 Tax=Acrocarpospora sp. B8E8 TaxID=3153572 RepID=UPI00325E7D19
MRRSDRRPRQRLGEEARRQAILRAAGEAFSRAGYEHVSVDQVAATAGASQALVHRYFGSKSKLYVAVVEAAIGRLLDRQRAADATLRSGATALERLAVSIGIYLDTVKEWAAGWRGPFLAPSGEPAEAAAIRQRSRWQYVRLLHEVLELDDTEGVDYALYGYLGFLDAACLAWSEAGYPDSHRQLLTDQALSALDGALRPSL